MANKGKKNRHNSVRDNNDENKDNSDKLEFQGEVIDCLPSTFFKVKLFESGVEVLCTLAGKLRQNRIRLLLGDKVTIEVSPYDLTRGRVTWRR